MVDHILDDPTVETAAAAGIALHIDFETRGQVDLRRSGAHVYAEDPDTDVWCACYAIDEGPIATWLPKDPPPEDLVAHVQRGGQLWAHNSVFERLIWKHILTPRYGWPLPKLEQWNCTLARAYAMALPGSLENAAASVGLTETKDAAGYKMMMRMAKPRRTINNRPVWWDEPKRIQRLVTYCRQDVVVERELHRRLNYLREQEHRIWLLDQRINDRGLRVDYDLCLIARELVIQAMNKLNTEIRLISDGHILTVNSVTQIINYCKFRGVKSQDRNGKDQVLESIRADAIEELLCRDDLPGKVRRVLEIRREASKVSVQKISALIKSRSKDGYVRGLLAYHAASTGRWAGRRFQPQNIKRPVNHDQDTLISIVRNRSISAIELLTNSTLETISDILRGLIVATPGKRLYVADYANIEGRALAWLADETWKVDAFKAYDAGVGPDLYKLAYARAFMVPLEQIDPEQRQLGKVMELALGYQGGVGAFQSMAYNYGVKVSDERANALKKAWRDAHPNIVQFWYDIEAAALNAVRQPGRIWSCDRLRFRMVGPFLYMQLPSGRALSYPYAKIMNLPTPWKDHTGKLVRKDMLTYKTVINPSNSRRVAPDRDNTPQWSRISAYGGLLTENAVQAIARDVMAEAMLRLELAGFPVILTVHDEIVAETRGKAVSEFQTIMEQVPDWASGFPIVAKAWAGDRYKKD